MSPSSADEDIDVFAWDRTKCVDAWMKLTGVEAGRHVSLKFLRKALAFELQVKAHGGHSAAVRQQLRNQIKGSVPNDASSASKPLLTPETQLIREWNGRIYRVNVRGTGFEMDGQSYRSLSAVAKRITGAGWSGPRFFGLNTSK